MNTADIVEDRVSYRFIKSMQKAINYAPDWKKNLGKIYSILITRSVKENVDALRKTF
ncbi:MAG: hypothetical protein K0R76_701 [Alphaproteobacteria bacterium]|jgi:hypothetical protein|nr:hypothetical protein [Alphaproteobacteria bacterium]